MLRYMPENITPEHRQHLAAYASLPYKTMLARDHGARGILLVSGPNSQVKQQLVPLTFDTALAGTSIGALSITDDVADGLLRSAGKTLQELQDTLDSGAPVPGVPLPDVTLTAVIGLQQERRTGRNVLARLSVASQPAESLVVLGAHIDHLGHGASVNSRARADEQGQVHAGADDNASGVAGILEIAQYLADLQARGQLAGQRDVLFAAWSGEELGLLGSGYFVRTFRHNGQTPATLTPAIAAYLNFDMIGRLTTHVYLQGVGSSSVWPGAIERGNVAVGVPIVMQPDSYLPTDATSFYLRGVPILSAFTGAHADYHSPRHRRADQQCRRCQHRPVDGSADAHPRDVPHRSRLYCPGETHWLSQPGEPPSLSRYHPRIRRYCRDQRGEIERGSQRRPGGAGRPGSRRRDCPAGGENDREYL